MEKKTLKYVIPTGYFAGQSLYEHIVKSFMEPNKPEN
jgi:hypothetical protein